MHQLDYIHVQTEDFSMQAQYQALTVNNPSDGAVVTFVGLVRDMNEGKSVTSLELEHYPAMVIPALQNIVDEARQRWTLGRVRLIHRVGKLTLNEQIVFVGVSAKHRGAAFAAAEFIMDFLKTQAPFWKKETTNDGSHWVQARHTDQEKAEKW